MDESEAGSSTSTSASLWVRWALRIILVVLLSLTYLFAWRPARSWIATEIMYPVLRASCTAPACSGIQPHGGAALVRLELGPGAPGLETVSLAAPAGIRFLLPGLFLLIIGARGHYLFGLWMAHIVLVSCALGLASVAAAGFPLAAHGSFFITQYGLGAVSLGVPALALARRTR